MIRESDEAKRNAGSEFDSALCLHKKKRKGDSNQMNILVCVKQVPDLAEVTMDQETKRLNRAAAKKEINPFDLHAVEEGVRLRERFGGMVTAITMGPDSADDVLRVCYMHGVNTLVRLTDPRFAGSDTFATASILAAAIRGLGTFDLIFCGRQAIDGDTSQVGPELAEQLGIPHISYVHHVEIHDRTLFAIRTLDDESETVLAPLPALVTVDRTINEPRIPIFKRILEAGCAEIKKLTLQDMPELDTARIGIAGSPTKTRSVSRVTYDRESCILNGEDARTAAETLVSMLFDEGLM